MGRIAFITCADLSGFFPSAKNPLLTHDDQVAADALAAHGHAVRPLVWGRPTGQIRADGFDLLILRSTWDYMDAAETRAAFLEWIAACELAGLPLENPAALVRWNLDKHYLADLQRAGVPIVPTRMLAATDPLDLAAEVAARGPLVIKPAISAAGVDAHLIRTPDQVRALDFEALRAGRDFLVQPFIAEVLAEGEWSLVFIAGRFTHAVLKRAAAGEWRVQDERGGTVLSDAPPAAIREAAERTMARLPAAAGFARPPLYARVDVLRASDPVIGEVELIEPELFFLARTPAGPRPHALTLAAFCQAVAERLVGPAG